MVKWRCTQAASQVTHINVCGGHGFVEELKAGVKREGEKKKGGERMSNEI